MLGRRHIQQNLEEKNDGEHKHEVDIETLKSGVYLCRLNLNGKIITEPFVVVK
jgi:hypothetical protein